MASYGTELLFPFQIDSGGRVAVTADPNQIVKQRIEQIVLTIIGERVMRPEWGSGAWEFLFDNQGSGMEFLIIDRIKTAVQNLTTGIVVNNVTMDNSVDPTVLTLLISYSFEVLGDTFTSEFITNVGLSQHGQVIR